MSYNVSFDKECFRYIFKINNILQIKRKFQNHSILYFNLEANNNLGN